MSEIRNLTRNGETFYPLTIADACPDPSGEYFGYYEENPEWIRLIADHEGKVLAGIKADGSIEWVLGVPQPIKDYISENLESWISGKVDKIEGKSLIDSEIATSMSYTENPEFLKIETDSEDKIISYRDKDGTLHERSIETEHLTINGEGLDRIINKVTLLDENTIAFIPIFGQSIAVGDDATPSISNKTNGYGMPYVYRAGFNYTGGECDEAIVDPAYLSDYYEQYNETSAYATIEMFRKMNNGILPWKIVTGAYGAGGASLAALIDPAGVTFSTGVRIPSPYSHTLKNTLRALKLYCNNNNMNLIVPAWCWIQGESNMETTTYKDQLLSIQNDWNTFCKNITGQTDDVIMICYETSAFGLYVNYDVFPYNVSIGYATKAQYELCKDNSMFVFSTPIYFNAQGPHNIHLLPEDQKVLGAYQGKVLYNILKNRSYKGIYIGNMSYDGDSKIITLFIHVPTPPLVVDESFAKKVDNCGFSIVNQNNEDLVEEVEINYDRIYIKCSSNPNGCILRYGGTSQYSLYMPGASTNSFVENQTVISSQDRYVGPRGNIHDSCNETILIVNQERVLYNLFPYVEIVLNF